MLSATSQEPHNTKEGPVILSEKHSSMTGTIPLPRVVGTASNFDPFFNAVWKYGEIKTIYYDN